MASHADPAPTPNTTHTTPTHGTDISECAGWGPTTVPRPGSLSAPSLGVALDSWGTAGRSVRNEVGELVVTAPMPSMPPRSLTDVDASRVRRSYCDAYPRYGSTGTRSASPTITR